MQAVPQNPWSQSWLSQPVQCVEGEAAVNGGDTDDGEEQTKWRKIVVEVGVQKCSDCF